MGLFSSVSSYIGVDIGTSSIKLVELENFKNQARLKTYGYADVKTNVLSTNIEKNNDQVAKYINFIMNKANVQTKQVIAALPTFSVFNFIINLPPMPKKDLDAAIKWEAKKFIPVPIDEMILDWKILNKKKIKIPKNKSAETQNIIKEATAEESKNNKDEIKSDNPTDKNQDLIQNLEDRPSNEENKFDDKQAKTSGVKDPSKVLGQNKDDGKNYRILLTAAPKNLVARYIDIFKRAKLNLLSLETEAFALARALMGNDTSTVMIVDIGATTADICVIEDSVPILNRGIDTGGNHITKTIMNSMNVNKDRAEQFKRDFGLSSISNKNVPDVIQRSLNSIINEIKYVFELYRRQGNAQIDKIIITGGSAFLPSLTSYLSELLKLPVVIGDPWDRIIYPLDLKPVLQEIGPRMAVSIGLASRDI
jgi:Tfp pilus assembly PilM family ATPase